MKIIFTNVLCTNSSNGLLINRLNIGLILFDKVVCNVDGSFVEHNVGMENMDLGLKFVLDIDSEIF